MVRSFHQCESHPGRLLTEHLRDVAIRASSMLPSDPWPPIYGLFHDVGKATSYFAAHLNGENTDRRLSHHAALGSTLLLLALTSSDSVRGGLGSIECLDLAMAHLAVRGHHTGLKDLVSSLDAPSHFEKETLEKQLCSMDLIGLNQWLGDKGLGPADPARLDNQFWLGYRIAVRRLLKQTIGDEAAMERLQRALLRFGVLIDSDRDSAAEIDTTRSRSSFQLKSKHVDDFRVSHQFAGSERALQSLRNELFSTTCSKAAISPNNGGIFTLTAPTGSAKTLAAIGWASKRREVRAVGGRGTGPIIYALPFTSVIDQNAQVLRSIIDGAGGGDIPGALAEHHHLADFGIVKSEGDQIAHLWAEGWRADVVCTTFVQVVQALFHGACADARRFRRLTNATLILDEVQAIPVELWPLIRTSLRSLSCNFGVDVLLVTATQPAIFRGITESTELVPETLRHAASSTLDRYDAKFDTESETTLRELAQSVAAGGCSRVDRSLVVVNTVREALDLFALLSELRERGDLGDCSVVHLSTNLRPKDRRKILFDLMRSQEPCILASTQVVEAGVDLSFDRVYRANAPIDSLIQSAGRCNRHAKGMRGKVFVVELTGCTNRHIYGAVHMDVARRVGQDFDGRWLREPELVDAVTNYFHELSQVASQERSDVIMSAVEQLEFGSLRGLGDAGKAVVLIGESQNRVPHFVETDEEDSALWSDLVTALNALDNRERRARLRRLRTQVSARVVEVPKRYAAGEPGIETGMVHIPMREATKYYDAETGWRRKERDDARGPARAKGHRVSGKR